MQTKSKIQLVKEELDRKNVFRIGLVRLMDKFLVEDAIFTFDGEKVSECTKGYFEVFGEYDSIEEAIKNYSLGDSVRILENKVFQVGKPHEKLSAVKSENKIIDVATGALVKNEN